MSAMTTTKAMSLPGLLLSFLACVALLGTAAGCADAPPSTGPGDQATDTGVDQSDVGGDLPDSTDLVEEDGDIPDEEDLVPGPLRVTGSIVAGGGRASGERYSLRAHVSVPPQPSESVGSRFRLVTGGSAASEGR
jgi:hypothetical protein